MSSDPYAKLAKAFTGGKTAAPWVVGDVVSTNPLEVEYGGVPLDEEDLVINAALLMDPAHLDTSQIKGLVLKVGDTVALIPDAEQHKFLLLAKVVLPDE